MTAKCSIGSVRVDKRGWAQDWHIVGSIGSYLVEVVRPVSPHHLQSVDGKMKAGIRCEAKKREKGGEQAAATDLVQVPQGYEGTGGVPRRRLAVEDHVERRPQLSLGTSL